MGQGWSWGAVLAMGWGWSCNVRGIPCWKPWSLAESRNQENSRIPSWPKSFVFRGSLCP